MDNVDVAIIGGGPAGLTAAATLARQLHTAVVFDNGKYRNGTGKHMHTVLTWDHKDPQEYRETARKQILDRYNTIQFADIGVQKIEKKGDSCFIVQDETGKEWEAKKVILAVGSSDVLPDIEGYAELWKKKIYHCLFCHGYEDKGAEASAVLAVQALAMMPPLAVHMADNAKQLSSEVTILTHGSEEVAAQVKAVAPKSPFRVDSREIARLKEVDDGVEVHFKDGNFKRVKFLVHGPLTVPQGEFAQQLGLELAPTGDIKADAPLYQTTSRGVFAAGDCITPYKVVPHAIASGNFAAVAVATQLQAEKYEHVSLV